MDDGRAEAVIEEQELEQPPASGGARPGVTLVYVRAIAAARNPALGTVHKSVLYSLAARFYRDAECWPGGDTLRGDAGTSNGALYRALDDLGRWGIVRRSPPRKGRPSSTFSIDLARLATMDVLAPFEPVSQGGRAVEGSPRVGEGVSQGGRQRDQ